MHVAYAVYCSEDGYDVPLVLVNDPDHGFIWREDNPGGMSYTETARDSEEEAIAAARDYWSGDYNFRLV